MSAPAPYSLQTGQWKTGANYWATWPPSRPCSTASSITATCSSAVPGAGARKPRPRLRRGNHDFAARGLRPCDPLKAKSKPFHEGNTKTTCALPLVGTEDLHITGSLWKTLAQTGYGRVQLNSCPGRGPLAGFEVATYGRF